jgi:hypothetical protein
VRYAQQFCEERQENLIKVLVDILAVLLPTPSEGENAKVSKFLKKAIKLNMKWRKSLLSTSVIGSMGAIRTTMNWLISRVKKTVQSVFAPFLDWQEQPKTKTVNAWHD